jgi:transcriptional antiterminator RfaH
MAFWACAQLIANQERLALHLLGLAGFTTYFPRILVPRKASITGRRFDRSVALFPGYCFVEIQLQWHAARRTPGVLRLVHDGERLAHVPDQVISNLRSKEKDGFVQLPKQRGEFERGDKVMVTAGPFEGHLGLYEGMKPRARVEVLLSLFGSQRAVELPRASIRPV